MAKSKIQATAKGAASDETTAAAPRPRVTRSQTLIDMMRTEAGASAAELGAAVGWQVHSVRGFIAGTLRKRSDLTVLAERKDGVTRYRAVDNAPVTA
jgi:hypothetical protein